MISMQPPKNVLIDYVSVDTKNRALDVKPARIKILVESLEQVGRILSPLLVTITGVDSYKLVSGATRLAAAKQLGWSEVPICIISGSDDEIKLIEIEENLGRHDLTHEERERLLHIRKMHRGNIDKALAEIEAYKKAHPEETAAAEEEAKKTGDAAVVALSKRGTKKTAGGGRPKRSHRATGGKKNTPKAGSIRTIAKKHGVSEATLRRRAKGASVRHGAETPAAIFELHRFGRELRDVFEKLQLPPNLMPEAVAEAREAIKEIIEEFRKFDTRLAAYTATRQEAA